MIHRLLYDVLTAGVAEISADLDILERFFLDSYCLESVEIEKIRDLWAKKPPAVIQGYARTDVQPPLYSITLQNESEDQHFLGDEIGIQDDPDLPGFGDDIEGSVWQHGYNIHVYSEHPDATAWYYEAAKIILQRAGGTFNDNGLFEIHMAGMELMPDPRYIPEHLFVRQLTFQCKKVMSVLVEPDVPRVRAISGVHVDTPGESSEDVGGVETNVTPYVDTDE